MARRHPGEVWKILDLLTTIKTEAEAREASNVIKGMSLKISLRPPVIPTASSLYASNQAPKCVYCEGDHYSSACTIIKEVKDRHTFFLWAGRCFNCLKPQHRARQSESTKKCRHCHKKHHQSICDKGTPAAKRQPPPTDRDMLRFLWLKEPFNEDSEITQYRFARLVFGLRPSPAVLGAVISLHIEKYHSEYPRIVNVIDQSLYVDDLVSGGGNF